MIDIELGLHQRRFCALNRGIRHGAGIGGLVIGLQGDRARFAQIVGAHQIAFGQRRIGAGRLQVGRRLGRRRFVGTRIDHEQDITGLDALAVLETDFGDAARHFRAHLGIVHCIQLAGEIRPDPYLLGRQGDHIDRHCRGCDRRGRRVSRGRMMQRKPAAAQGSQGYRAQQQRPAVLRILKVRQCVAAIFPQTLADGGYVDHGITPCIL